MKKERKIITVCEEDIKKILAKEYGAYYKDVHILHEDYEFSGLSGHAIPATRYMAKISVDKEE